MNAILQPWPWYVAGPLIGLTVPILYLLVNKTFGISSSFRHMNSICLPSSKLPYLKNNNWRANTWNLALAAGIVLGAFVASQFLSATPVQFLPETYFSISGVARLFAGGILVGFGTRYAGGCTSGHTISGISNLQGASVVASVAFFAGGLLMVNVLLPLFGG